MTMGSGKSTTVLIALLMIAGLSQQARAATYQVGGTTGWVLGISATFFDDWAKKITFHPGDILDFSYSGSTHNVFEVSAADLASCNVAAPIRSYSTLGGASLTIGKAGTYYYICGIPGHCVANMKMTVVVSAATPALAPAAKPPAKSKTAPALSPHAPATTPAPVAPLVTTAAGPASATITKSDSSGLRSGPVMIIGAILCVFVSLLFQ